MKHLKRVVMVGLLACMATLIGCAYGGAAGIGTEHVVITKNDGFLMGALRSVYVCKVTKSGLSECRSGEAP